MSPPNSPLTISHSWVKKNPKPKVCNAGHALITKEIIIPSNVIKTLHAKNWVIPWNKKS